jgi:hypothetical protein
MASTANKGVKWHFNPPLAPHFRGVFETMVKPAKEAICAILGSADIPAFFLDQYVENKWHFIGYIFNIGCKVLGPLLVVPTPFLSILIAVLVSQLFPQVQHLVFVYGFSVAILDKYCCCCRLAVFSSDCKNDSHHSCANDGMT